MTKLRDLETRLDDILKLRDETAVEACLHATDAEMPAMRAKVKDYEAMAAAILSLMAEIE